MSTPRQEARLNIVPITLRAARVFVGEHHRHNDPPRGHLFSVAVERGGDIVGVGIASRPVARLADDGRTVEIVRVCVRADAPRNGSQRPKLRTFRAVVLRSTTFTLRGLQRRS